MAPVEKPASKKVMINANQPSVHHSKKPSLSKTTALGNKLGGINAAVTTTGLGGAVSDS